MNEYTLHGITNNPLEELSPIATKVLGEDAHAVGALSASKIGRSVGQSTAGIYRVAGEAETATGTQSWSAVVKILGIPESPYPFTLDHPLREFDVYCSGVFANVCGGVRTARLYALQQRPGQHLMWLEDLSAAPQPPWVAQHFIETARNLGRFNAHWPERSLPQWEWLAKSGLQASFGNSRFEDVFKRLAMQHEDPYVRCFAPGPVAHELFKMWEECDTLLAKAEATAKGVCHGDCHPKNLFPIHDPVYGAYTVAIDWDRVGIGPLGVDIGHLIASPIIWLELSSHDAAALVDPIFDAYLKGLSDSGWSGNEDNVRLTYLTRLGCEALRLTNLVSYLADHEESRKTEEKLLGYPFDEICVRWGMALEFLFGCKNAALQLAKRKLSQRRKAK